MGSHANDAGRGGPTGLNGRSEALGRTGSALALEPARYLHLGVALPPIEFETDLGLHDSGARLGEVSLHVSP